MLEATKEIVIALINTKQIGCSGDVEKNIQDVKNAIKEIYQQLQNTKFIDPQRD